MEEKVPQLVSPLGIVIDLLLTLAFFYFMSGVVATHVTLPEESYPIASPAVRYGTTACISGVFWLALNCFRVTFTDQRKRKAQRSQ